MLFRDGQILLWSCGKNRTIEPPVQVEESLTCCDIFDAGSGFEAQGDAEMEAESDGKSVPASQTTALIHLGGGRGAAYHSG